LNNSLGWVWKFRFAELFFYPSRLCNNNNNWSCLSNLFFRWILPKYLFIVALCKTLFCVRMINFILQMGLVGVVVAAAVVVLNTPSSTDAITRHSSFRTLIYCFSRQFFFLQFAIISFFQNWERLYFCMFLLLNAI